MPKKEEKRKFKYIPRTKEQIDKRARQSGGLKDWFIPDEIKTFVPKEGGKGNILRILPPTWEDADHYGYDVYVHFGIGGENSAYLCPKKMKNDRCPICEELGRAQKEKMPEEYIKSLEATKRVLMYVIDRKNEEEGPLLWSAAWTLDKDIAKRSKDKRTGKYREIDNIDDGYDVIIDREGAGLKTKYSVEIDSQPSPLGDDSDEWLNFITDNPIPDILTYFDYDHIKETFEAGGANNLSSKKEKDEDKPISKKPSRPVKDEDEDEDELEEDETDNETDEEDEGPSLTWEDVHNMPRKKLNKLIPDTDIDEDDATELEDEELADAICESLGIKKKVVKKESGRERLSNLRKAKK